MKEPSISLDELAEHPLDVCDCGDYRRDHAGSGPCAFNPGGFDMCHGGQDCMAFRLHVRALSALGGRSQGGEE